MTDEFQLFTCCVSCGEMKYCRGLARATVRCRPCREAKAPVASSDELGREIERANIAWIRAGMPWESRPRPDEINRRLLARRAEAKDARERRLSEQRRLAGARRKAERIERDEGVVADLLSGRYLEEQVAERYGLSVKYVRQIARQAA